MRRFLRWRDCSCTEQWRRHCRPCDGRSPEEQLFDCQAEQRLRFWHSSSRVCCLRLCDGERAWSCSPLLELRQRIGFGLGEVVLETALNRDNIPFCALKHLLTSEQEGTIHDANWVAERRSGRRHASVLCDEYLGARSREARYCV